MRCGVVLAAGPSVFRFSARIGLAAGSWAWLGFRETGMLAEQETVLAGRVAGVGRRLFMPVERRLDIGHIAFLSRLRGAAPLLYPLICGCTCGLSLRCLYLFLCWTTKLPSYLPTTFSASVYEPVSAVLATFYITCPFMLLLAYFLVASLSVA